jgi:hypothetical protein
MRTLIREIRGGVCLAPDFAPSNLRSGTLVGQKARQDPIPGLTLLNEEQIDGNILGANDCDLDMRGR